MKKLLLIAIAAIAINANEADEIKAHREIIRAEIMQVIAKVKGAKNAKEKEYYTKILNLYLKEYRK